MPPAKKKPKPKMLRMGLNMKMYENELQDVTFLASVGRMPIPLQAEEDVHDTENTDDEEVAKDYEPPYLTALDLAEENRGVIKGTKSST